MKEITLPQEKIEIVFRPSIFGGPLELRGSLGAKPFYKYIKIKDEDAENVSFVAGFIKALQKGKKTYRGLKIFCVGCTLGKSNFKDCKYKHG